MTTTTTTKGEKFIAANFYDPVAGTQQTDFWAACSLKRHFVISGVAVAVKKVETKSGNLEPPKSWCCYLLEYAGCYFDYQKARKAGLGDFGQGVGKGSAR